MTLAIARKLKAHAGPRAEHARVLTRDGDYFIPLQRRVEKARKV